MTNLRCAVAANSPLTDRSRSPKSLTVFALVLFMTALFLASSAFASQLVFKSGGGTATLGNDFIVTSASVTSPAGTMSLDCPITSVGGGTTVTYACTGGSFSFQSTDGLTTVNGAFTTADLYLSASGGGRGAAVWDYLSCAILFASLLARDRFLPPA